MSTGGDRLRIEVEASRPGVPARRVAVSAPAEVSTGTVLDVLGAHLGLSGAAGAVQARSLVSGCWVDRSAPVGSIGLLRGERVTLDVGLAPGGAPGPLTRWPGWDHRDPVGADGRVAVNRPPRTVRHEPAEAVPVPSRRRVRRPRRFPLGAMLVPLIMGLVLVVFLRRWEIALFSLFSPVMVLWNHLEERRAHRDEVSELGLSYEEAVAATFDRVRSASTAWTTWMHQHHPTPDEVTAIVRSRGGRLWERVPGDPDFLHVRLGTATRHAPVTLRDDQAGQTAAPPSADRPDYEGETLVAGVPVPVDLAADGLLAVQGDDADLDRVGAWIVAQLAALHSPADVALVGVLADGPTREWWRWLPHLAGDLLPCPPVAGDRTGADALLDAVAELGAARRTARDGRRRREQETLLVVVVDDRAGPDPALLRAVCDHVEEGIRVVWLGRDPRAVPTGFPHVLSVDHERGTFLVGHTSGTRLDVLPDRLGNGAALDLSSALAPLRDASDARHSRSLPERLSLEELVPELTSPAATRRRWESAPSDRLLARLGVSTDGPVDLDLGPEGSHALVGGTTGAGKSELLQTMVASLAASYPPGRVGFLLVDYKGGAAFKDAQRLPHCVGVVTDLDEHLTRRVLQALDAEIRRREELLAGAGARDLTELRSRLGDVAPEDLLIVVDEFATLAKEIPEFVEGVVDVAARGRSLGLRLVLATQRPAGVINDRIRANVGVRIALRLNDEADSIDVIGRPEAAHVPRTLPGRAHLKVHRHVVELQSAYVGGPPGTGVAAAVQVDDLDPAAGSRDAPLRGSGATVLEAVVDATSKVVALGGWRSPHVPWLPALPGTVLAADLTRRARRLPAGTVLGLADVPRRQSQPVVAFDLAHHQSLLVFGTSRSGKTTVLRTLAAGLIATTGPDALHVYGLDFAGQGLHVLESAPHCVGVVGPDDPGRTGRMLRRLGRIVEERQRAVAAAGLTGFEDLVRTSAVPVPRIVVLLDGYGGAAAALERLDGGRLLDRLERLVPDGPAVGVHFLITADRRAAVPSALTSVVTTRLVLRLAEREEYALLGLDTSAVRAAVLPPGRGFIQGATEVQVAVTASADPEVEHRALVALCDAAHRRWPDRAPPLGALPHDLRADRLPTPVLPWALPFAVGDAEVLPVELDLADAHALVAGPPRSGRTSLLDLLAVTSQRTPGPPAVVRVAGRRRRGPEPLAWDVGPVDGQDSDAVAHAVATTSALLAQGRRVLVVVDDADALSDPASAALEALARRGRDDQVRVVAAVDNRWAARAYGGVVPEVRRSKHGVLLAPDIELDGDLLGVRLRTPLERLGTPGRGFWVQSGAAELVQVAEFGDDGTRAGEGPSAGAGVLGG